MKVNMTYKGKAVRKHNRGNWYARVRHGEQRFYVYGRTQTECYNKLKIVADQVELAKHQKFLQKFTGIATSIKTLPIQESQQIVESEPIKEPSKVWTLKEWHNEWITSYKTGVVRARTLLGFTMKFKHLKTLHDTPITDITQIMLQKCLNDMTSPKVKDAVHNMIKQMFSVAFNNKLVEMNPAHTLPRPKQVTIHTKRAFTQDQETEFINICLDDLPRYAPFVICCLQGLRKGEMLALRPDDFNFTANTLRVDESYDHLIPDDLMTKNQASNRVMPMFEITRKILLNYQDREPTEMIFLTSTHELNKRLKSIYEKAPHLPNLTMHELRHTFITRCHERKIEELTVQRWVGHNLGSTQTKAVYTHISKEAETNFIDIMNGQNTK